LNITAKDGTKKLIAWSNEYNFYTHLPPLELPSSGLKGRDT